MLAKFIISFAYFLDSSKRYKSVKGFAYDILENPKSKLKPYFDAFIIFLVLITVSILIYDIAHHLPYHFEIIENIAVSIFIVEWIGRFWIHDDLRYLIIKYHEKQMGISKRVSLKEIFKIIFFQNVLQNNNVPNIIE